MAIVFFKLYLIAVDYLCAWVGIAENDYVLKLAMFTTLFNVIGVIVLYPFISQMENFLNKYVKPSESKDDEVKPMFLSDEVLQFSDSALQSLTLESIRLLESTLGLIAKVISFQPEDVQSQEEIPTVLSQRNQPNDFEFDTAYHKRI